MILTRKQNTDSNQELDEKLAKIFEGAYQAPDNPWFVRKVMNRLPERKPRQYVWIEYVVYLIALVAVGVAWWFYADKVMESGVITVYDMLIFATLTLLSILVPASFVEPLVKRWL